MKFLIMQFYQASYNFIPLRTQIFSPAPSQTHSVCLIIMINICFHQFYWSSYDLNVHFSSLVLYIIIIIIIIIILLLLHDLSCLT
jgi:hypothetical protein